MKKLLKLLQPTKEKTKLLFVLAKVDNLVKNGRLSKLIGTVVGLLNIRMVGEASETGTLELLQKARGPKKSHQQTAIFCIETAETRRRDDFDIRLWEGFQQAF